MTPAATASACSACPSAGPAASRGTTAAAAASASAAASAPGGGGFDQGAPVLELEGERGQPRRERQSGESERERAVDQEPPALLTRRADQRGERRQHPGARKRAQ